MTKDFEWVTSDDGVKFPTVLCSSANSGGFGLRDSRAADSNVPQLFTRLRSNLLYEALSSSGNQI